MTVVTSLDNTITATMVSYLHRLFPLVLRGLVDAHNKFGG